MKNLTEQTDTTIEKSNSLVYRTSKSINNGKETIYVTIRLDDQCKNGHQDFSITGDIYRGTSKNDSAFSMGGCIHDEIIKYFPEFKIFIDLHLSDFNGAPMYAGGNGYYNLINSSNEVAADYIRVSKSELTAFLNCDDEKYFSYLLYSIGIIDRWKVEADQAIKQLEQLTGKEFVNDSARSQFEFTQEQIKEVQAKIKTGYYTPEAIAERKAAAIKAAKDKVYIDILEK